MSRRKESKMERMRAEEDELDRKLQEAGMYEDGMDIEMKKLMLQTLEESRKSAQEEEHQRKQWEKQEVQIYKDTLNKSFNKNAEKNCHAEIGCNEEHGNEDNSGDSDVVALPPEDGADTNCLSGSDYVIPDLDLLRSGSPELLVSSESPSPSCSLTSSAPIATRPNSQPSVSTVGGSRAQPHGSEEDLFCDLQTLETSSVPKTPKRNSQQICKMNDSNSQGNEMKLCTMSATNVEAVEVEEHEANNITSSITKSRKPLQNNCQIEPRRSLRSSSIEVVPSPSAKSDKGLDQINRLSQPLSCNTRNNWQEGYEEEDGVQLLSPIIGQKKILESLASSNSRREKKKILQDAKVSNTLEVQSIQHTIEATIDDDEDDFILPTPGASLSTEANRFQSSYPVDSRLGEPRDKLQKREISAKEISTEDENIMIQSTSQEVNSSPMNSSSKLCDKVKEHTSCANMDLSDNEENLSYNFKSDRKRKVNVFFIEENPDVPLKRRRLEEEEPSKAYFRSRKEPAKDCVLRILNMINAMMKSVGEYQSKHIRDKMKWSFPLTVDKRLKDSLERSKMHTRKHGLDLDTCSENVIQHRTLRNAHKATDSYEVESQISEDSLPDICMNDGNWIDVQGKKERRKRGLHLGLGRKQSKHSGLLGRKDKLFNSSQDYEKSFVYESDEAEDFEIFPSSSQQKHSSRGRIEIDKSSMPKDVSTECTEVLSSKMHHSEVEKNIEAVGTTENIEVESHLSGDEDLLDVNSKITPNNKRRKVESLELSDTFAVNKQGSAVENRQRKRPMRRTFILSDDKSFDVGEPSTSSAQNVETSRITNLTCDVQLTTEQLACQHMSPLSKSVVKDSGNCLKSSNKKDYSGKKVDTQNCVSTPGGKDDKLKAGRSNNVEICIVEDDPSVGTSGFNLTRGTNKESRRGKLVQDQIRPAPLRLKKNGLKNKGETEASKNQFAVSSGAQQIASGVGPTSQRLKDDDQAHSIEREEDGDGEMVPCPLCLRTFPREQIEVHASDCSDAPESPQKQPTEVSRRVNRKQNQRGHVVEDVEVEHITEGTKSSGSTKLENTRTPTGHERCLICKKTFKEGGDYFIHVNACKRMVDITDSIVSPMASRTPGNKSGNPEGSGNTPDRGIARPRPNVRTGSLFEHLEGNLEFINGDITDPAYRSPNIALVQILNCVAVKPHGLSQVLAEKYPYCGSYRRRRAIGTLNRAVLEDRPQPGNIEICRPNTVTEGPAVVNVFGQFYMGKEKNRNLYTKRLIQQLQSCNDVGPKRAYKGRDPRYLEPFDHQLLSGLLQDTSENRICWFCEGLNKLAVQLRNGKFSLVIFPSGIGCGLAGGNWERDYLPAIKQFSRQVNLFGIRVKIVRKIVPQASDSEIAIIGTMKRTVKPFK